MSRRSVAALASVVALLWTLPSWAQAPKPDRGAATAAETPAQKPPPEAKANAPEKDGKEQAPKVKVERTASGRKVFRITTGFVIEGRIQKPNAFYVLQRSQINYDWARLRQDFTPRIVDSVNESPF